MVCRRRRGLRISGTISRWSSSEVHGWHGAGGGKVIKLTQSFTKCTTELHEEIINSLLRASVLWPTSALAWGPHINYLRATLWYTLGNSVLLALKIPADREALSSGHLRQLLCAGTPSGNQCGDGDATCLGQQVSVGMGDLADQVMCPQQCEPAADGSGSALLLCL